MSPNFWLGIAAAQTAAHGNKSIGYRKHILSIVGGLALALLIGVGLLALAALNG